MIYFWARYRARSLVHTAYVASAFGRGRAVVEPVDADRVEVCPRRGVRVFGRGRSVFFGEFDAVVSDFVQTTSEFADVSGRFEHVETVDGVL